MDDFDKLTVLWTVIQVTLLLFVLISWFGVTPNSVVPVCKEAEAYAVPTDSHEGFVFVWFTFNALLVSVGGTYIMKNHRTPIGVGLFVGSIILLTNWMLCIDVMIGGQISKINTVNEMCKNKDKFQAASKTSHIFAMLFGVPLLVLYTLFGALLIRSKDDLLSDQAFLGGDGAGYPAGSFSELNQQQEEQLTAV